MRRLAALYAELDRTTATSVKVEALARYLRDTPPEDAAWGLYVMSGRKLKRLLAGPLLHELAVAASGQPGWMVEACYAQVGDFAETIALLLPPVAGEAAAAERPLHTWIAQLRELPALDEAQRRTFILQSWQQLPDDQRFVFTKLLTGELRIGVSQSLVVQALARVSGLPTATIAHRMTGDWQPHAGLIRQWLAPADATADASQPYPFFLASPLEVPVDTLGDAADWLAEWKWDGIRAQALLRVRGGDRGTQAGPDLPRGGHEEARRESPDLPRGGDRTEAAVETEATLWSRGEERLDGRFPELEQALARLPPGVVLDGEIVAWRDGRPLPFTDLQKRIGRLKPGAKLLAEKPVALIVYDLLEFEARDIRKQPLAQRRATLQQLLATAPATLMLSPQVPGAGWDALAAARDEARTRGVEGLILKRWTSRYEVGRKRGDWWKWKIAPHTIDAVLVYAQGGSGRRANLFTDYTFALWDDGKLVPVAKAYSGLDNAEIERLDRWIRANTLERFGPVRAVKPEQVFELAFEAINPSTRHKSGVAVRFPRILRWREDKRSEDANQLADLRALAQVADERKPG